MSPGRVPRRPSPSWPASGTTSTTAPAPSSTVTPARSSCRPPGRPDPLARGRPRERVPEGRVRGSGFDVGDRPGSRRDLLLLPSGGDVIMAPGTEARELPPAMRRRGPHSDPGPDRGTVCPEDAPPPDPPRPGPARSPLPARRRLPGAGDGRARGGGRGGGGHGGRLRLGVAPGGAVGDLGDVAGDGRGLDRRGLPPAGAAIGGAGPGRARREEPPATRGEADGRRRPLRRARAPTPAPARLAGPDRRAGRRGRRARLGDRSGPGDPHGGGRASARARGGGVDADRRAGGDPARSVRHAGAEVPGPLGRRRARGAVRRERDAGRPHGGARGRPDGLGPDPVEVRCRVRPPDRLARMDRRERRDAAADGDVRGAVGAGPLAGLRDHVAGALGLVDVPGRRRVGRQPRVSRHTWSSRRRSPR